MKQIPNSILSLTSLLMHILAIPAFFLCFILLYRPEWGITFLDMGRQMLVFNILMLMCIMLGILCASRIPMVVNRKHLCLRWTHYILWILAEMVVTALFMGLYMTLMYRGEYGYFPTTGKCLLLIIATISYPYIIINLLMCNINPELTSTITEDDLIRFSDNTKRLKLVIAADAILYIQADENYIHIHYMDGERLKEYTLRNSMRSIEDIMRKHGITRCHRSFFVNPKHVKVLRKDKEGTIVAELDIPHLNPVTVSQKYYDNLNNQL